MIQCCTSRLQFTDGRADDAQKLDFLCALGAAAMICDVQPLYQLISCVHLLSSPNFYSILVSCCFTSGLIPEAPIHDELADFGAFKHWIICPCPTFVRAIHLLDHLLLFSWIVFFHLPSKGSKAVWSFSKNSSILVRISRPLVHLLPLSVPFFFSARIIMFYLLVYTFWYLLGLRRFIFSSDLMNIQIWEHLALWSTESTQCDECHLNCLGNRGERNDFLTFGNGSGNGSTHSQTLGTGSIVKLSEHFL